MPDQNPVKRDAAHGADSRAVGRDREPGDLRSRCKEPDKPAHADAGPVGVFQNRDGKFEIHGFYQGQVIDNAPLILCRIVRCLDGKVLDRVVHKFQRGVHYSNLGHFNRKIVL